MTWASGFFRLWILLTLLWCGATVAILGTNEFKGLWRPRVSIAVEYSGGIKDDLDGSRPREELRRQIIAGANKGIEALTKKGEAAEAKKQFEQLDESADQLLKVIDDESTKRADRLQGALTVLLAPPVALLVFGVAIGWVASGFRKRAA